MIELPNAARKALLRVGKSEPDICPECKENYVRWYQSKWTNFCSKKCSAKYYNRINKEEILRKRRETFLSKYGVENASQVKEFQEKKKKTLMENFGVENPSNSKEIQDRKIQTSLERYGTSNPNQNKDIREKGKKTMLEKYGVENASQVKEFQEKKKKTFLMKYGVLNPTQNLKIKEKMRRTFLQKYGVSHPMNLIATRLKVCGCRYEKDIEDKITSPQFWEEEYFKKDKTILQIAKEIGIGDTNLLRYFYRLGFELKEGNGSSHEERELKEFIENSLGHSVESLSFSKLARDLEFSLSENSRKRIDIYIPDLKVAFEYNGIYWHSSFKGKHSSYHLDKTLECERLGIRLIHIWSDDWTFKKDLMKEKILSLLNLNPSKVFARKCKITLPSKADKKEFYNSTHIKGDGSGSVDLGLTFEDKLVACMSLKEMGKGIWDLNRYACRPTVVGGFSKLLSYFKQNFDWNTIYTYADRSWSQGRVYLKNGFSLTGTSSPGFHGVERGIRIPRQNYTHAKLQARFPEVCKPGLTQLQILEEVGIPVIWDCGQLRFELHRS